MFEHEIISRIIEERCNRLLAIFSPNFLKSPANQFLVSYAQALALGKPNFQFYSKHSRQTCKIKLLYFSKLMLDVRRY